MRTLENIISNLTEEQKQLLADTINYGAWGDCQEYFSEEEPCVYVYGYITDDAYRAKHFERRTLSNKFRSLFKALGLEGDRWCKRSGEMVWRYDWWDDGSGSVLFIREELSDEFEAWAKTLR